MPKRFAASVSASAGMPSAAARCTASSMRTMPSATENSLCILRWTNSGTAGAARGAIVKKFYSGISLTMRLHAPGARGAAARRNLHCAVADFRAPRRDWSDRERVLARRARCAGVVAFLLNKIQWAAEKLSRPMETACRRGLRLRRRPRLLACLDPAHLGGELDAAREPRLHFRHAGGVARVQAAPERAVPRRAGRGAGRRGPAGEDQPRV